MNDDQDDHPREHIPQNMTDNEQPDDAEWENPNEYEKHTVRRLGERGSPVLDQEEKKTDLERMEEQVEETVFSFCNCGAPHTLVEEIYRCCSCDNVCCSRCRVLIRRYNYCPNCVQLKYGIDKTAFKALYLLNQEIISPEDLLRTETTEDEAILITIDAVAETLIEQGYLNAERDGRLEPGGIDTEDVLSSDGKEALHIGEQLFGADPDIEEMKERVRITRVSGDD